MLQRAKSDEGEGEEEEGAAHGHSCSKTPAIISHSHHHRPLAWPMDNLSMVRYHQSGVVCVCVCIERMDDMGACEIRGTERGSEDFYQIFKTNKK